jgi:uncharacterized protein (TIGR02145 family)
MTKKTKRSVLRIIPIALFSILAFSCEKDKTTVTDIDGNEYATVTIGNQVWMASELKTTKYKDGTSIAVVTDNTLWAGLTTGALCEFNNTGANSATYGKLYNWYAIADPRGICPVGWHVPAKAEWESFDNALGGASVAGGKIKETGTTHWLSPNTGATNESGFTALGGGYRNYQGVFKDFNYIVGYWSSTQSDATFAYHRSAWASNASVDTYAVNKKTGFNVRCIQDL